MKIIYFFVETKKKGYKLDYNDFRQLINYINPTGYRNGAEWGLLTNGNDYILVNSTLGIGYNNSSILEFNLVDLNNKNNLNKLKYFSYDYLFRNHYTNYYKYFAVYKYLRQDVKDGYANNHSINQYKSTLTNFFDYLSNKGEYHKLEEIRPSDFKSYIVEEIGIKRERNTRYPTSKETIKNKYAYIKGFYDTLKKNNIVNHNPFENIIPEKEFYDFKLKEKIVEIEPITKNEIKMLLAHYENIHFPERNKLIFLLFLYLGLDKKDIQHLKTTDIVISNKKQIIKLDGREIPLTNSLKEMVNQYLNFRKKCNIKSEYLFSSNYETSNGQLDDSTFNFIISQQFNKLHIPTSRKKQLNSSFIKASLIKRLFDEGFHVEEIAFLTGLSMTSLEKYIPKNVIINKKDFLGRLTTKHPYIEFFK